MKVNLTEESCPIRIRPLLWGSMASLLLGTFLVTSCALPKRQARSWNQMNTEIELAREEVQIRLEKIPSGVKDAPYAGIRAQTRDGAILLLVDTGTSVTLLRESVRDKLKVSKLSRARLESEDSDSERRLYTTSSISVGPLEFTNEAVTFLPDDQVDGLSRNAGRRVDGILGATLLRRGEIEFRGPENELVIRPFDRSKIKVDNSSLPLIFIPDSNTYAIPLRTETGMGSRLLLDTGTNVELVLDEHRPLARKVMESTQTGTWNYDSVHGSHEVRVFELPFGILGPGISFPKGRKVCVDSRRDGPLDGVIGIPVFWRTSRILLNSKMEMASFVGAN
ncbi:MAG: retropepsin-like domain-containing protein [Candidatus Omnitrophica bacterium]|nr:retropepsin-like domain-containing protein [Candidatus Omnitrophota bacterium]